MILHKNLLLQILQVCTDADCARDDRTEELAESEIAAAVFEDPEQFLQLYHAYYNRILSYLYRRTADCEAALDLTSRTFLAAFESLRSHRYGDLKVKPWLYRLATNAHLDQCRAGRRWMLRMPLLDRWMASVSVPLPDVSLKQQSEADVVRCAIQQLPEAYRSPLMLRYYEDLSFRDLAQTLGMGEATARSRVHRGLRLLKHELEALR